jgi:hypothetical protein
MTRHGLPAAKAPSGMSRVTMLPAPMTARDPIRTPARIKATPAHPDIRSDLDRFSEFLLSAQVVIERMQRCKNLHAGTEERVVSDSHFAYIEHDAIEIEEYARTQVNIGTVVAVERRLHPDGVATSTEKILEDPSSLCSLRFRRAIERAAQVSCALSRCN